MNIQNLVNNLKNTIEGKQALLEEWKSRPASDWESTGVSYEAMKKMVEININELQRILEDAIVCSAESIARNIELEKIRKAENIRSWAENPDRMGGQFTQDEINDSNKWV